MFQPNLRPKWGKAGPLAAAAARTDPGLAGKERNSVQHCGQEPAKNGAKAPVLNPSADSAAAMDFPEAPPPRVLSPAVAVEEGWKATPWHIIGGQDFFWRSLEH